jgi:hypothetical protein
MKRKSAWLFIAVMGLAAACRDDEKANAISSDEAASIIALSLSSNGVNSISSTSAEYAADASDGTVGGRVATCGFKDALNFSTASDAGEINTFSFDFNYKFSVRVLIHIALINVCLIRVNLVDLNFFLPIDSCVENFQLLLLINLCMKNNLKIFC